jgi:hypothetical protein
VILAPDSTTTMILLNTNVASINAASFSFV